MADSPNNKRPVGKLVLYAILSVAIYTLFFMNANAIQKYLAVGGAFRSAVVVAVAICISLIYGNFAGTFWEVIGVKAKKH